MDTKVNWNGKIESWSVKESRTFDEREVRTDVTVGITLVARVRPWLNDLGVAVWVAEILTTPGDTSCGCAQAYQHESRDRVEEWVYTYVESMREASTDDRYAEVVNMVSDATTLLKRASCFAATENMKAVCEFVSLSIQAQRALDEFIAADQNS